MDPATTKFLIFLAFSVGCLVLGYTARRRNWVGEHVSRTVHMHTVAWTWSPVALLALWELPIDTQLATVILLQPIIMVLAWRLMAPLAQAIGCDRSQIGVMSIAAVLGNQGFTMGAYLCYTLLDPAAHALGYATAFVTSQAAFTVLIFYPVAQSYGGGEQQPMGRLLRESFLDIPALPLYAAASGVLLSYAEVPVPEWTRTWHILDLCFFGGAFGGYGGIGLRLRIGDSRRYLPHHALLAGVKFLGLPTIALGLLTLAGAVGLGLSDLPWTVVVVEAAMPAAIASVIVPNLFHLDARMASVLWLWNTAFFAVVVLPIILVLLL